MESEIRSTCKVCHYSGDFSVFDIQERMLGLHDVFQYSECPQCKTIALNNPPPDMSKYYPGDYYSYNADNKEIQNRNSLRNRMKRWVIQDRLGSGSVFGVLIRKKFRSYLSWLIPEYFRFDQSILDVGCGNGFFLLSMANAGFKHLRGIDPYNDADISYPNGVNISKSDIFSEKGKYDVVMLHHSFEHMDEPEKVLSKIRECLNPGGLVLIRIPVSDAAVWKLYGTLWVQLDAPRHFFIHSVKGMKILAERTGFQLDKVEFDSYSLQYWGSELYRKNLPLSKGAGYFSAEQIENWELKAAENNRAGAGDQACFYLKMRS